MESGSAAEPKARGVNARGVTAPGVMAADVKAALAELADGEDAGFLQRFFKPGPGQYGAGDVFIGVRVPATRGVAKLFQGLPLDEIAVLLDSEVHEHRLAGLIILNARFARASRQKTRDDSLRETMVWFYLDAVRRGRVNNWDLVDSSAEFVLGEFLIDRPRDLLFDLAASEKLWERRVAMLSTFAFLKQGDASTTIEIAGVLLGDREDLIHKAVGWMLREVGKRVDPATLIRFLDENAPRMPRTALSYATEHLSPELRAHYRAMR